MKFCFTKLQKRDIISTAMKKNTIDNYDGTSLKLLDRLFNEHNVVNSLTNDRVFLRYLTIDNKRVPILTNGKWTHSYAFPRDFSKEDYDKCIETNIVQFENSQFKIINAR